jgi:hypothetical protein
LYADRAATAAARYKHNVRPINTPLASTEHQMEPCRCAHIGAHIGATSAKVSKSLNTRTQFLTDYTKCKQRLPLRRYTKCEQRLPLRRCMNKWCKVARSVVSVAALR